MYDACSHLVYMCVYMYFLSYCMLAFTNAFVLLCPPCGAGYYADTVASTACRRCEPDTFSGREATECTACSAGRYSNASAAICLSSCALQVLCFMHLLFTCISVSDSVCCVYIYSCVCLLSCLDLVCRCVSFATFVLLCVCVYVQLLR